MDFFLYLFKMQRLFLWKSFPWQHLSLSVEALSMEAPRDSYRHCGKNECLWSKAVWGAFLATAYKTIHSNSLYNYVLSILYVWTKDSISQTLGVLDFHVFSNCRCHIWADKPSILTPSFSVRISNCNLPISHNPIRKLIQIAHVESLRNHEQC